MFRTENNVPQNYIEESRDFQLLCRLYDLTYNSLRYNIDSMINLNDPMKINDQFLPLLGTKVGFITNKNIDTELWRHILSSFQYALKYKGSIKGVRTAVSSILRYEGKKEDTIIKIEYNIETNILEIYLSDVVTNVEALNEYLRYILPAGCVYKITLAEKQDTAYIITLGISDDVQTDVVDTETYSSISKVANFNDSDTLSKFPDKYATNNQITEVMGSNSFPETSTNTVSKVRKKNVKK